LLLSIKVRRASDVSDLQLRRKDYRIKIIVSSALYK
jgi:hypothetical protein